MTGLHAKVGSIQVSSDDCDEDEEEDDDPTGPLNDLTQPGYHVTWVPNNRWATTQERDDEDTNKADAAKPFGFIPMNEHSPSIEIEEDDKEETTVGQPGMGKVITGMDSETEKALFSDLYDTYGNFSPSTVKGAVALIAMTFGLLGGFYIADIERALGFIFVAAITAFTFLRKE